MTSSRGVETGDSLIRRSMSRTGKDIERRVDIAIVDVTAITAYPLPYSKVCDTVRPRARKTSATRTDLGGKVLIGFHVLRAMLNSLVREHRTEARPRGIQDRLGDPALGQSGGVDLADCYVVELPHDAMRELVQEIPSRSSDPSVDSPCEPGFARALSLGKALFQRTIPAWVPNLLARRESRELYYPQIDPYKAMRRSHRSLVGIDYNVQEPVSSSITAKVRSVSDFAFG